MKKFLQVLGAAALVAGFAPYSFEKNEETGESSVKALLWNLTTTPDPENASKPQININFGLNLPTLPKKDAEEDLFADEITVTYTPVETAEEAPAEEPAAADAPCCCQECSECCEAPAEEEPTEESSPNIEDLM